MGKTGEVFTEHFGKRRIKHLLCALVLLLAVMALPACSADQADEAELQAASDQVAAELNAVKEGKTGGVPVADDLTGSVSEEMLDIYDEKLRDFDFGIVGAEKAENENADAQEADPETPDAGEAAETVRVTVRIKTFDFGTVYLETWKEYMAQPEAGRDESQFYSDLFTRIAALGSKDYTMDVAVLCIDPSGDGNWQMDIKTNEALMNALSGDMLAQMKDLAEE